MDRTPPPRRPRVAPAAIEPLEARRLLAAGDFDLSFSFDGHANYAPLGSATGFEDVAVQPDGKIIAVGRQLFFGASNDWLVVRFNPDGTRDPSFGTNGAVTAAPILRRFGQGLRDERAESVVLQADGKIVVSGRGTVASGPGNPTHSIPLWMRFNTDGSIDTTFGVNGVAAIDIDTTNHSVSDTVIGGDGRIVSTVRHPGFRGLVVQLTPSGQLDPAFGAGGVAFANVPATAVQLNTLTLQPDGKILVAGAATRVDSGDSVLARLTPSGSLDLEFGVGGSLVVNLLGQFGQTGHDNINAIALRPDGRIIAGGFAIPPQRQAAWLLAYFNPDGSIDTTMFAGRGARLTFENPDIDNIITDLILQPDGKLLAVGSINNRAGAARYKLDGLLDPDWGGGLGHRAFQPAGAGGSTRAEAAALDNGRLVTVNLGFTATGQLASISRLEGDPPPPAPVSISGVVFSDVNRNGVRDPGEPGLSGWNVILDTNRNGFFEPNEFSVNTDAAGVYRFDNLEAVSGRVMVIYPLTYRITAPRPEYHDVVLAAGDERTGLDFAAAPGVVIQGTIFDDLNGNYQQNANDPGLEGQIVYIDLDNDGQRDVGEPFTISESDGFYAFEGIRAGTWVVRVDVKPGRRLTFPGSLARHLVRAPVGSFIDGIDFGVTTRSQVSGVVFNDLNRNGRRDEGEPGIPGVRVFVDSNGDGRYTPGENFVLSNFAGNYFLSGPTAGNTPMRVDPPAGQVVTQPLTNLHLAPVSPGARVFGRSFGLAPAL